jgi:flavin reductase (DIM6/NTAB) family NADH-FMN oxidoreductase RutF
MRKAWNIPIQSVYSLVTTDANGVVNMNICTYVTGISMQPKRFAIAVYKNTKTLENLQQNETVVLQLLNEQHAPLVNVLGKKSGFKYDKLSRLRSLGAVAELDGYTLLRDINAYLVLKKGEYFDVGDHVLYMFNLFKSRSFKEHTVLTNQYLMEQGFIL